MALKVELKPGERIIIGTCVITNDQQRTRLFVEGDAPILREKDILTVETANTPTKRVYLALQLMYLDNDIKAHQDVYFELIEELLTAVPSMNQIIDRINNKILRGELYKALRDAKSLISYEKELLGHV